MVETRRRRVDTTNNNGDTSHTSTDPEQSNRYYANYYRQKIREEDQRARSSLFRRIYQTIHTTWYQSNISLGPFMLDPWERVLSLAVLVIFIVLCLYALFHTKPIVWVIEKLPCYVQHQLLPLIGEYIEKLSLLNGKNGSS